MKRAGCRTGSGLNGPCGAVLCQLQEERPISRAPAEERLASVPLVARRVPEIVVALRYAWEQPGPPSLRVEFDGPHVSIQIANRIPCGEIGFPAVALTVSRLRRLKGFAVDGCDDEDSLADWR